MNVLVIPEDFRKDQYILKPLFDKLFQRLGVRSVQVEICLDPLLGGIGEALKPERISEIVSENAAMRDIIILCVDRDGVTGRRQSLDNIEAAIQARFGDRVRFFAENAWEELETWVLAGLDLPGNWRWRDVRAEVHVKEQYFEPLAVQRLVTGAQGRWPEGAGRRSIAPDLGHPAEVPGGFRRTGAPAGGGCRCRVTRKPRRYN